MSERIEKAINELGQAIAEETRLGVDKAKELGLPFITSLIAQVVGAAAMFQAKMADKTSPSDEPNVNTKEDTLGAITQEEIVAIKALIGLGKTDAEISNTLLIDESLVKLFRN